MGKVNVHLVSSTLASNSGEALVFSGTAAWEVTGKSAMDFPDDV